MHRKNNISSGKDERGVIITLVAVFLLCVVGAMAALSIDVVTIYTARSEAQLAADGAALAAARVIANSGATSDSTGALLTSVESSTGPAQSVALQVAEQNQVGGANLTPSQVTVTPIGPYNNPTVTVKVQVTNLPTFFARIWGTKFITVAAWATAEAYNPSGGTGISTGTNTPVAPICVKPWLLPNIDPTSTTGNRIFDPTSGAIDSTTLLGSTSSIPGPPPPMQPACTICTPLPVPAASGWKFYPGDTTLTFTPPTQSIPTCTPAMTMDYEKAIAGCVQTPIACNSKAYIDMSPYGNRRYHETAHAVNCLTHSAGNGGDTVNGIPLSSPLSTPFEFVAGTDNPIPGASGNDVMVSDSLVTVPVFDVGQAPPPPFPVPINPVQIIGFVQLFLSPTGAATQTATGQVTTTVINLAGCGNNPSAGAAIIGNGASPVAVRLISPP
jgi:Flp pilus assembly protein TadG